MSYGDKSKLTQLPVFNSKRRRSSRFLGIPTTERELTEEFKHKLKESLKLPDDVTDEEILGLSAISETAIIPLYHQQTRMI